MAQINGQTSHFKSTGIEPLGDTLLDLTIGVNGEFEAGAKTWNYEVSFSEDPTGVGPSVDFTLTAVLGLKF